MGVRFHVELKDLSTKVNDCIVTGGTSLTYA